jgi:hypothetical protein
MADTPAYPGVPGWAKVLGLIALVAVVLFAALHLAGHGPGDHGPGGRAGTPGERR